MIRSGTLIPVIGLGRLGEYPYGHDTIISTVNSSSLKVPRRKIHAYGRQQLNAYS